MNYQTSLQELADLVDELARDSNSDRETGWLARLLVIRSCGYLEQVVGDVAMYFAAEAAGGSARSFAQSWIPSGRNPTPDHIVSWVGRFDAEWSRELEEILNAEDEEVRRELSLLVDRRNRIAHGLNEGVTVRKALDLKALACNLADWFILRFNPDQR